MVSDSAIRLGVDAVHMAGQMQRTHGKPGFFLQFAPRGLLRRFTESLRAAGQAPRAFRRGVSAPNQQHRVLVENGDPDADQGAGGECAGFSHRAS